MYSPFLVSSFINTVLTVRVFPLNIHGQLQPMFLTRLGNCPAWTGHNGVSIEFSEETQLTPLDFVFHRQSWTQV